MTGSNQFSTADDQFKRFIDATDSYINNSGLDLVKYNKDVETILNLTPFELRSLKNDYKKLTLFLRMLAMFKQNIIEILKS